MRRAFHLLTGLLCYPVVALANTAETIKFKEPFAAGYNWLAYGITLAILLILALVIAKKHKPDSSPQSQCKLIEKKYLGNKTVVYVLEYQKKQYLLADNQHALAMQPINSENRHEAD